MVDRLNKYDRTREELMKCAQKKCSPSYGYRDWSPILAEKGRRLREIRKKLDSTDRSDTNFVFLLEEYEKQKNEWSSTQNRHIELRQKHLEELADAYSEKNGGSRNSALKQIINAENAREIHRKHRGIFKDPRGGLKHVLIKKDK